MEYDAVVIGGGPAGLTAGMYLGIYKLKTIVLEKGVPGGQLSTTQNVANYPGFPHGINGLELGDRMSKQLKDFSVELKATEVTKITKKGKKFTLKTTTGTITTKAIIICSGAQYRRLKVPGEDKFLGRGVSYCATCDAIFTKGKNVVVVGGGNSAVQETIPLSKYAKKITMINIANELTAEPVLLDELKKVKNVKVINKTSVQEIIGDKKVEKVKLNNGKEIPADMIFVFIGLTPATSFLKGFVELSEKGFINVNRNYETNVENVWAAGDCTKNKINQATIAVGEATIAAFNCYEKIK